MKKLPKSLNSKKQQKYCPIDEWQRRTGHPTAEGCFKLSEAIDSIPKFDRVSLLKLQCTIYRIAKMQRAPVKSPTRRTSQLLELVHLDISGKVELSISGAICTVSFLEDNTATAYARLSEKKSEFLRALEMCKNRVEVILKVRGFAIQNNILDRSGENFSSDVVHFISMHGIHLKNFQPSGSKKQWGG